MGLKLTLKPGERVAVNGAVLVNGDRRTSFVIENQAQVLRERDIMQAEEATTPARRIYLPIMLMALDPNARRAQQASYERRLVEFAEVVTDPAALDAAARLAAHVANGDYYKALQVCRTLIEFDDARLSHVA